MDREWTLSSIGVNGAGLSKPGVVLQWSDVTVDVNVSEGPFKAKTRKRIVHGSRGVARPGEIVAVMGPSGAGKTSLFNSLALRGAGYEVSGQRLINGRPYSKEELGSVSGFVFQESLFPSYITCEEALSLAADFKLPRVISREEKRKRVDMLLDAFDLRRCAKTRVGDSVVKGISGGEKKRLSIAVEALTGPSLLFLDEPTTGLDSASSLMVVKLLRELADSGTTVVMVLHQPRASILRFIDTYLVLSDGRDVFFGGMKQMLWFFESVNLPIPLRTNPLDFVLDVINTNDAADELTVAAVSTTGDKAALDDAATSRSFAHVLRGNQANMSFQELKKESMGIDMGGDATSAMSSGNRKELAQNLAQRYRDSGLFEQLRKGDPDVMPAAQFDQYERSAFSVRLSALIRREFLQKLRNPEIFVTQILGAVILGLIMGSIYWQLKSVYNTTALISFAGMMVVFLSFHLILTFPLSRQVYLRDRDNGLYNSLEYYFSTVLAGLPGDVLAFWILATILYWMTGLRPTATAYFTFCGFSVLVGATGSGMMYFSGAVAPSPSVANSIASIMLLFAMVLNSFFIVYSTIPVWYRWIADINFMRFGLNAIYYTQFTGVSYNCTPGVTPNCLYANGTDVLNQIGVAPDLQVWLMAVYLLVVYVVFHLLACLSVTFMYTGYATEIKKKVEERKKKKKKQQKADNDDMEVV